MEIKEQLQRILEDVPRVYEAGKEVGRDSAITDMVENMRAVSGCAKNITFSQKVLPFGRILIVGGMSYTRVRNLVPEPQLYNCPKSGITDGIEITVNADGSIHYKGTATKNYTCYLQMKDSRWQVGNHTFALSGCPAGGSEDTYCLKLCRFKYYSNNYATTEFADYGDGCIADLSDLSYEVLTLAFMIRKGVTVDFVVKPQLELDVITEFEPYLLRHTAVKRIVGKRGDETTFVYEIPDELINACPDYGVGAIGENGYGELRYNYIDFTRKTYHQMALVMDKESASEYGETYLSDASNAVVSNWQGNEETDISQYIKEKTIIPIAKGDVISFETAEGEVAVPVPYVINFQTI